VSSSEKSGNAKGSGAAGKAAPERIVAAAYRLPSGLCVSLPPPNRHHDILHRWGGQMPNRNSGFLTSRGRFVGRAAAYRVAAAAGQLVPRGGYAGGLLFSENVW
jgi:hypothetical protein